MRFLQSENVYTLSVVFLFIIYFISRILFLEADLPLWDIGYYQAIDEFYYTLGAFNLYHYNDYDIKLFEYISEPKYVINYFTEVSIALSLKIFGNNYYGLRMASVFAGASILFLVYKILKKYLGEGTQDRNIILLLLAYMIVDFAFLLSNKVAEPTIFRMLAFMIVFYTAIKISEKGINPGKSFILGFLALASVVYVYSTNFFIIPSVGLFIILITIFENYKKAIICTIYYLLGIVISGFIFLLFYKYFFNSNYIFDFIEIHFVVTSRVGSVLLNIYQIFHANVFNFNTSLLLLTLVSMPLFIYTAYQKKHHIELFLFSSILMFFLQTIFVNDYPQRKLIFILPLILSMIAVVYINKTFILETILYNKKYKTIFNIYLIFSFLFSMYFIDNSLGYVSLLNYLVLTFTFILILLYVNKFYHLPRYIIQAIVGLFFLTNIVLSYQYVFSNPTYKYKTSMIEAGEFIDNQYTVGWSHGMRLYNKSIPLMSAYWYKNWEQDNYQMHRELLLNKKRILYEFVLLKQGEKISEKVFKVFDINEVTGDKIGLIKYKK